MAITWAVWWSKAQSPQCLGPHQPPRCVGRLACEQWRVWGLGGVQRYRAHRYRYWHYPPCYLRPLAHVPFELRDPVPGRWGAVIRSRWPRSWG